MNTRIPTLSPRLKAVAGLVGAGRKFCDVGSDHAYLPAYLYLSGTASDVTAADVADRPLENARRTLEYYSLTDKVKLVRSDGLEDIDPDTREIAIAGMGGDLIVRILTAAPWVRDPDVHLILQPMTRSAEVRRFLTGGGFRVLSETPVMEGRRVYIVLSAVWDGVIRTGTAKDFFFGSVTPDTSEGRAYIEKQRGIMRDMGIGSEF